MSHLLPDTLPRYQERMQVSPQHADVPARWCLCYGDMCPAPPSKLSAVPPRLVWIYHQTRNPERYRHCSYFHPPNVPQIAPSPPENNQNVPQILPVSIVKSQNDDARKVTRKEAVLVVQGEPTSLQPPQLPGDSKTISQLQTDLGEALTQITRLENLTVQLQKSLKLQAEIISSNTTQIARLFNNMDYRIQGKILPRILDIEEYLQKFKQAEAEVVPSLSSVEVGFEVGVD